MRMRVEQGAASGSFILKSIKKEGRTEFSMRAIFTDSRSAQREMLSRESLRKSEHEGAVGWGKIETQTTISYFSSRKAEPIFSNEGYGSRQATLIIQRHSDGLS